jgi:hypothetical protein
MLFAKKKDRRCQPGRATASVQPGRHRRKGIFAAFLAMAVLAGAAPPGVQGPAGNTDRPYLLPEANRLPDVNDQMKMREQLAKQQNFEAANAERRKQIADDSARLLKLANDLKAEVDKTTKDMLSLTVIRKADEIERLAHNMKEKMKLTVGGN